MGLYINPTDMTKEEFIQRHALSVTWLPPETNYNPKDDTVAVCLVNNGGFTAAAIAYSTDEIAAFSHPADQRPKAWFFIPYDKLKPFLFGQSVEGRPED
jgi:hypothetical protein